MSRAHPVLVDDDKEDENEKDEDLNRMGGDDSKSQKMQQRRKQQEESQPSFEFHRSMLQYFYDHFDLNIIETIAKFGGKPFPRLFHSLCREQQMTALRVISGQNEFITGDAGVGKSFLLKCLIDEYGKDEGTIVCASTGIAAVSIGGVTLHSAFQLGVESWTLTQYIDRVFSIKYRGLKNIWLGLKRLFIDEISMVSGDLWDVLEQAARVIRQNQQPFGGIQLIVAGDFLQMPPVQKFEDARSFKSKFGKKLKSFKSKPQPCKMAFESKSWKACFPFISCAYLVTPHRQEKDSEYYALLNEIRYGQCSEKTRQMLYSRVLCDGRLEVDMKDGILPTYLYGRRNAVECKNIQTLNELEGEVMEFKALDKGQPQHLIHCRLPELLQVKIRSEVMCLINDPADHLFNGLKGKVVHYHLLDDMLEVQFQNHTETTMLARQKWPIRFRGKLIAQRTQFPICLCNAITVHKCQGLSFDKACMWISGLWEYGHAYTALSRGVNFNHIYLASLDFQSIKANPVARDYMLSLKANCQLLQQPRLYLASAGSSPIASVSSAASSVANVVSGNSSSSLSSSQTQRLCSLNSVYSSSVLI